MIWFDSSNISKIATFLQSARCPFVKQPNLAALHSELVGSETERLKEVEKVMKMIDDEKGNFKQNTDCRTAFYA